MSRSGQWTRFGVLAAVTILLGVVFASTVNSSRPGVDLSRVAAPPAPAASAAAVSAAELGDAFSAASGAVRAAVVFIQADIPPGPGNPARRQSSGSGFIVTPDGYIITNNHVVEGAERIAVQLLDRRQFTAQLIGRDASTDIAVVRITGENLPVAPLGDSDSTRIGEWVLAIGNPLGQAFAFTVTAGIVSAKGRLLQGLANSNYSIQDFIQTDAKINVGNSGGPLVDINGRVIGVNSALLSSTGLFTDFGFAIPINLAQRVAEMLISEGRVTRSLLGVSIRDALPEDAEYVGLDSIYGVTIQSFSGRNSPAEQAGLELGDVIVALDGQPVGYTAQLQQVVGFKNPGEAVSVTVQRRGGARTTFRVQLMEADLTPGPLTREAAPDLRLADPSGTGLGVELEDLAAVASRFEELAGLGSEHTGPIVLMVDPQGPSAGRLERGNIITHVEGARVTSVNELREALARHRDGAIVSLGIYRLLVDSDRSVDLQTGVARVRIDRDG